MNSRPMEESKGHGQWLFRATTCYDCPFKIKESIHYGAKTCYSIQVQVHKYMPQNQAPPGEHSRADTASWVNLRGSPPVTQRPSLSHSIDLSNKWLTFFREKSSNVPVRSFQCDSFGATQQFSRAEVPHPWSERWSRRNHPWSAWCSEQRLPR